MPLSGFTKSRKFKALIIYITSSTDTQILRIIWGQLGVSQYQMSPGPTSKTWL